MPTAAVENSQSTTSKLAHLTAKAVEGKILAEDLVDIGKRKPTENRVVHLVELPEP